MGLHVDVIGRREPDAPCVLLSSGLGGAAGFWKPQLEALAAHYRVLAYDQRGTGRSAEALAGTAQQPYAIEDMAADVLEVLDQTSTPRCHLVGHALGGLVGLQLALDHPERLSSLSVVNGWSRPNPHTARCFATRRHVLASGGPAAYVQAQPIFLYPPAWCVAHAEALDAEIAHGLAHFQGETNLLQRIEALLRFDVHARLGALSTPTWVAATRDDVLVPWTSSRALADAVPHARFELFERGGHGFTVTEPAAFNASLLAFLHRVDGDAAAFPAGPVEAGALAAPRR